MAAERRRTVTKEEAERAATAIADLLVDAPFLGPGAVVAGYWPLAGELDPRPAMLALLARGHPLALPRMNGRGAPLTFRRWSPDDRLVPGPFAVMEPAAERPALRPGLVLVPLLAFDRRGRRLGYGAGFYDRTLAGLRSGGDPVVAAGLAFAIQEAAEVPADGHDQPLDLVLTERGIVETSGRTG